jgi:hypothetical protein
VQRCRGGAEEVQRRRCRGGEEVRSCRAAEVKRCSGGCRGGAEVKRRCNRGGAEAVQRCRAGALVHRCRGAVMKKCRGAEQVLRFSRGEEVQVLVQVQRGREVVQR